MNMKLKKLVPLLALLVLVSSSINAWSADDNASGQEATANTTSTAETTAPENVAGESGAIATTASTSEATAPENAAGENDTVAATASEPVNAGDTGAVEALQEPFDPFNVIVYKPLWALTSAIGDFNPIGKHVSAPLEESVPGLRVKGFINSITQVNTTSTDHNTGLGGRNKDWRLQKQEFRTQLELKYQANENIEFVNVNNFQYDGAYDFQDSDGLYTDGSSNQKYYSQFKRIVREAYVRGNYGNVNFTLGKQIVNWGKMDGKVIDFVNAADGRDVVDFHIGDYEWRAIGQWMANVSLRPTENFTTTLLWNPDFQPNVGPAGGSPWWFPFAQSPVSSAQRPPERNPSGFDRLADSEGGVRVDTTIGALSLSGIYYNGFDRDAVFNTSDNTLHHTRLNRYGYALDYGTSVFGQRLIIRSEALYSHGKAFGTSDPSAPGGIVKKDQLKLAVAFETSVGSDENKIDILYQPIWTRQLGWDSRTGAKLNDLLHVVNLSHSVRKTNDRLKLSTTGYISGGSGYDGLSYNVSAGWKFNDFLKATLAYNDFVGKDDDIPWGAYRKWKNVTLDVKYEF